MKKLAFICTAMFAFAAAPASADQLSGVYGGVQVGYHDIGTITAGSGVEGVTYGGYVGLNQRVGGNFVVGAEGNFDLGSSDIDSEYGLNAYAGVAVGQSSMIFLRSGYQWTDFNLVGITEDLLGRVLTAAELALLDGADDNAGGYVFGGGVQFGIGDNVSIRGVVDTVEFDTVKVSGGIAFHF